MATTGSEHFALAEFACPHCGVELVRQALLQHLEALRLIVRRPIPIVSGYRCPVHNAEINGAKDSQHMYAAAADLPNKLVLVSQAKRAGFTGIGQKGDYATHVDVRDGRLAMWTYPE